MAPVRPAATARELSATPEQQERYATDHYLTRANIPETERADVRRYHDGMVSMRAGASLQEAKKQIRKQT
jgi:hypothetical protein